MINKINSGQTESEFHNAYVRIGVSIVNKILLLFLVGITPLVGQAQQDRNSAH